MYSHVSWSLKTCVRQYRYDSVKAINLLDYTDSVNYAPTY
jgi:hypothetical protein